MPISSSFKGNFSPIGKVQRAQTLATGGSTAEYISGNNLFRVHTFTGTNNFQVVAPGEMSYLIVAGGGAGGGTDIPRGDYEAGSGGGGAGGMLTGTFTNVGIGTYTVTVGGGGAIKNGSGDNGTNSIFNGQTSNDIRCKTFSILISIPVFFTASFDSIDLFIAFIK
jgi:hypothetical protein